MTSRNPVALWIDDSVAEMTPWVVERLNERIAGFEVVLVGDTDEAVEFTLREHRRIFMFIQDSTRRQGTIIPAWKKLRSAPGPSIGFNSHQGDFYTYVVDALAPSAASVFAGFSFRAEDRVLINEWARLDPRIVLANKGDFTALYGEEEPGIAEVGRGQLQRWKQAGVEEGLSEDGKLLAPLGEELAVVCGARPDHLDRLTPRRFEELVAALFKNHGFTVELTSRTRDGGYDIVAASHSSLPSEVVLVEVKHFAPHRPVGVGVVRALYGVKKLHGASKALLVTSSYVSAYAKKEFSRVIPWELEFVERSTVLDWCKKYLSEILGGDEFDVRPDAAGSDS